MSFRSILLFLSFSVCLSAQPKTAATSAKGKSAADLADGIRPAMVKISQYGRDGLDGIGSGFVIRADGLIATNFHVIDVGRKLRVEMYDGTEHEVTAVQASDEALDLALLKIDAKNLPALSFAEVDAARQGDRVLAMGAPDGLAYTLVEGILSAKREDLEGYEGRLLLQLSMPIERGNSGGPLLDAQGRVLGIISMKHTFKENLGFAIPVTQLQPLIEKPNPVLMSRWLTIGALNTKLWKTLQGADWSQRAGIIQVEKPGDGFGGRALCLSTQKVPDARFEVSVSVKLDDESGAAGLAFCADGGDRHYGFYPSEGKLRLTRFDGPDVFSWAILANPASEHYRHGEWNHLLVRVDGAKITCFVNHQQVIELEDDGLRGGTAGLCKFRSTRAEFRGFRTGSDLTEKSLEPALAAEFRQKLQNYLADENSTDDTLDGLIDQSAAARRLLQEERRELEKSATRLRQLEKELHRRSITRDLLAELSKPEPEVHLLRCTLLLARHDNPEIDIGAYLAHFRTMVADLKNDPEIAKGTPQAVKRLTRYLFEENGFHGARGDLSSLSDSYMNEVLDDREGLPITLSVLYIELARELGIQGVFGVALPGRFMVGWRDGPEGELLLIDAFENGKTITVEQAALALTESGTLDEEFLAPATKKAILQRMLRNLQSRVMDESFHAALPYIRLLIAIEPDDGTSEMQALMEQMGLTSREEVLHRIDEWMRLPSRELPGHR
jgi:serine protease Do